MTQVPEAGAHRMSTERVPVEDRVVGGEGLPRRMRLATHAFAETLFTTVDGPPPQERLDWLVDDLDDFFTQAGTRARFAYRLCLWAVSVFAPLMILRLPPFRRLSREKRTHALERMERSFLGLAVFGAKAVVCLVYYEHPDAGRFIGYDGSCLLPTATEVRAEPSSLPEAP